MMGLSFNCVNEFTRKSQLHYVMLTVVYWFCRQSCCRLWRLSTNSKRPRRQPRRRRRLHSRLLAAPHMSFLMTSYPAVSKCMRQTPALAPSPLYVTNAPCFRNQTDQRRASFAQIVLALRKAKQSQLSNHLVSVPVSQSLALSGFLTAMVCIQCLVSLLREPLAGFVQAAYQVSLQVPTA